MASSSSDQVLKDKIRQLLEGFNKKTGPGIFSTIGKQYHQVPEEFIDALAEQKYNHNREQDESIKRKPKSFRDDMGKKRDDGLDLEDIRSIRRNLYELQSQKPDVPLLVSEWTLNRFMKYVHTLNFSCVPPYDFRESKTGMVSDKTFDSIKREFTKLASVHLGMKKGSDDSRNGSFLEKLSTGKFKQDGSRVFIENLITPILNEKGAQIGMGVRFRPEGLPNANFSHRIRDSDDMTMGLVKVKAVQTSMADSVVQCMLQLLILRTECRNTLFGLVSDAFSYIFIVLTPDGTFNFEDYSGQGQVKGKVKGQNVDQGYHDVRTWEDLHHVAAVFRYVLDMCARKPDVEDLVKNTENLKIEEQ